MLRLIPARMDRPILALGVAAACCALAAAAPAADVETSRVSAAFGNTVVTTYPDGRTQRIWLHEDGSWDGINRLGSKISGRWSLKTEKICLRQSRPISLPFTYCTDFPAQGAPGVQWAGKDITGRPIQLTLQKGVDQP